MHGRREPSGAKVSGDALQLPGHAALLVGQEGA
jgi:hypothetical protein